MRAEVEIAAAGDALDLFIAKRREIVHQVEGALGIVRQVGLGYIVDLNALAADANTLPPAQSSIQPALMPIILRPRHDEVLDLQHIELAHAKQEVARVDLVAKALAD